MPVIFADPVNRSERQVRGPTREPMVGLEDASKVRSSEWLSSPRLLHNYNYPSLLVGGIHNFHASPLYPCVAGKRYQGPP